MSSTGLAVHLFRSCFTNKADKKWEFTASRVDRACILQPKMESSKLIETGNVCSVKLILYKRDSKWEMGKVWVMKYKIANFS